jgi:hypothetical protein
MKGVYSMDRGTGALPLAPIAPATSRARATPPPPPAPRCGSPRLASGRCGVRRAMLGHRRQSGQVAFHCIAATYE